ncbi:MAG: DUF1116 domain-containing protein [Methylobacteriaceae bacterium]|jgi:hypothetical protein|nr:DUF1116 domain-containing protein [Methylobacteriaceae bacterium]
MRALTEVSVINVGLERFAGPLKTLGVPVVQLQWQPPAAGDAALGQALARLTNHPRVEAANATAFERYLNANPVLEGVGEAARDIPGMGGNKRVLLHSGPPARWDAMCGPQRGALIGAVLFEGWAENPEQAERLLAEGGIELDSCNHRNAVGPMAGVISPSMPVWRVRETRGGGLTFSNFNEGLGRVLRFGANGADVLARLKWMRDTLAPVLSKTFDASGPIELKPLLAQALHMGDEGHNRNVACTSLLFRKLATAAAEHRAADEATLAEVFRFIAGNDHFFLNISMAACKAMLNAAAGVDASSMVTVMARNGVDFGIQISAFPGRWFEAAANYVEGLYFPGYGPDDAARDLGDSAITETAGIGGFAMAAAPAIVQFVGGTSDDALNNSLLMRRITLGANSGFTLPMLNFAGTPAGIDIRRVVDTGILPIINTGIAHKAAGVGQIGAGLVRAPAGCFLKALAALAERVGEDDA